MHNVLSSRMHLLQDAITKNSDILQDQAAVLLKDDQELLASFKEHLTSVHGEISQKLSGKTHYDDASYTLRLRELERQLEFSKASEDKFKAMGQSLERELERNKELIDVLFSEKEDLIKQLSDAQKEIARNRVRITQLEEENTKLNSEIEDWRESAASRARRSVSHSFPQGLSMGAPGAPPTMSEHAAPRSPALGAAGTKETTPQRDHSSRMSESDALRIASEILHGGPMDAQARGVGPAHSRPSSAAVAASPGSIKGHGEKGPSSVGNSVLGTGFDESELREVIFRLKTLLDQERRTNKVIREDLMLELDKKTEAENLIRKAIDEARSAIEMERRKVITEERHAAAVPAQVKRLNKHGDGHVLNNEQRSALLATLLNQDRVLTSIVDVIFPNRHA